MGTNLKIAIELCRKKITKHSVMTKDIRDWVQRYEDEQWRCARTGMIFEPDKYWPT